MYRLFRRFERLAFGIVTASAVACAGYIAVERLGVSLQDLVAPLAVDGNANYALACVEASQAASCEQLQAHWKGAK
jgi:prolyl-tRNA editing enzyme YbaK/EbsC (Cys-tRNA(Pro) deacylase)